VFVKKHYSGLCISYSGTGGGAKSINPSPTAKNNSRLNRQKRSIHDAVEWMRKNATYKPLIFCLTVPVQSDFTLQNTNVSAFCENLRSSYSAKNYVWVREFTYSGRPHYHFVADTPFLDAVNISRYWSGLFGETNVNSIRLGTNPSKGVKYFVDSPMMSRYLTKYMGKGIGKDVSNERIIRTFGHSVECWRKSQPITYKVEYNETTKVIRLGDLGGTYNGVKYLPHSDLEMIDNISRKFTLCENSEKELIEVYGNVPDHLREFDDSRFSWICPNPLHRVYYGLPKKMQKAGKVH